MGVINALLIVKVRINAFIATIGTLFVFSGVAYLVTDGQAVTTTNVPGFGAIGNGTVVWGIPTPVVLLLAMFLVVGLFLRFTRFGSRALDRW